MSKPKTPVCDLDCFHCKFADCIAHGPLPDYYIGERPRTTSEERRKQMNDLYKRNAERYADSQAILAKARKAASLSLQTLAVALGVSSAHVSHMETGKTPADVQAVLEVIAKLAHVSIGTLMEMVK